MFLHLPWVYMPCHSHLVYLFTQKHLYILRNEVRHFTWACKSGMRDAKTIWRLQTAFLERVLGGVFWDLSQESRWRIWQRWTAMLLLLFSLLVNVVLTEDTAFSALRFRYSELLNFYILYERVQTFIIWLTADILLCQLPLLLLADIISLPPNCVNVSDTELIALILNGVLLRVFTDL